MPTIGATASHIASSLIIFAVLIVLSGAVAFAAARQFGKGSRVRQRLIFTLVGGIALLAAALFTFLRLRS